MTQKVTIPQPNRCVVYNIIIIIIYAASVSISHVLPLHLSALNVPSIDTTITGACKREDDNTSLTIEQYKMGKGRAGGRAIRNGF